MNLKKITLMLVITFILILGTGFASAQASFDAEIKSITTRIAPSEAAIYEITITNNKANSDVFTLSLTPAAATSWILTPNSILVNGSSTETIEVKLRPKSTTGLGTYQVGLRVRPNEQEQITLNAPVQLRLDAFSGGYTPTVEPNVVLPSTQDPREKLKMTILLRNINPLDLENIIVKIESELFYKEYNTSLEPRQIKTNDVFLELDPLQKPGEYDVKVEIYYPKSDKVIAEATKKFEIESYSSINHEIKEDKALFLTTEEIILTNNGNHERTKEWLIKANWFQRIFISTQDAEIKEVNGEKNLAWTLTLKPTETKTITVTWNYRPLAVIIAIIIIAIILYYLFRSPVIMLKEAIIVGKDDDGVSEIKVRLFIKNRSRRPVYNISLTDKLPRITELVQEGGMGSLKPSKITTTNKKGTLLYWDMDALESLEERIITYKMRSSLKIIGNLTLPRARAKFDDGNKKERINFSGKPLFRMK